MEPLLASITAQVAHLRTHLTPERNHRTLELYALFVTALLTRSPNPALGRPLTGLETLPASLIINMILTYLFIWWSGWHRDAHGVMILGRDQR